MNRNSNHANILVHIIKCRVCYVCIFVGLLFETVWELSNNRDLFPRICKYSVYLLVRGVTLIQTCMSLTISYAFILDCGCIK